MDSDDEGVDAFTYTITDGEGERDLATATIVFPGRARMMRHGAEDDPKTTTVKESVSDAEDDPKTVLPTDNGPYWYLVDPTHHWYLVDPTRYRCWWWILLGIGTWWCPVVIPGGGSYSISVRGGGSCSVLAFGISNGPR